VGIALILASGQRSSPARGQILEDLRRLAASFRVGRNSSPALRVDPDRALGGALTRLESVEGLGTALCEAARSVSGLPAAIALRDRVTNTASIVAVSRIADHRLIGTRVTAESACGRALMGRMPAAGANQAELLGTNAGDRRRRDEPGIAFPLHNGREGIGALVVFGPPEAVDPAVRERIATLALELAPHLSAAADVQAAEARSLTDELTGLPNRRVLERTMSQLGDRSATLLVVHPDRLNKVTEGFGRAAGDAALRHLAQLLARGLRDGDLAARYGEEDFALWLVGAGGKIALDVAARIRTAVSAAPLNWAGAEVKLTCSIGAASYPNPVPDLADVRTMAAAASRRARDAGGDRVEAVTAPVSG
jgi:diguanylate cyclase (GGDEF)-like protein